MGIENSKEVKFDFDDEVKEKPNRLKDLLDTIYDKVYWKPLVGE